MVGKRRADGPASKRTPADARAPKSWKARLKKLAVWTLVVGLVGALVAVAAFVYLYKTIDIPDPNEEFQTETSFVYYRNGENELGRFATQDRDSIPLDDMAEDVRDAVVAAENQSFWTDQGIDPKGILRAAFSNASGDSTQGASTITQQYVKILYLTQERSYTRKVKEAILSLKIQRTLSKTQVLEGYLNTIYFGRGAYGVQAAANAFFDKPAADLSLRESAVLASVLNNPTNFDPAGGRDARRALKGRYDYTLNNMAELDYITEEDAEAAKRRLPEFPAIEAESAYGGQRGHMLTMVRNELTRLGFSEQEIDGGGLRVTTTFDRKAMEAAEAGVNEVKPTGFPGAGELHAAVATVEPGTGAVRGFYAGQDYLDSQINWAVSGGQAGSTFKPFAVAAALEQGFSLNDTFDGNSPYELPDGNEVGNQGDEDYGSAVSLTTATENSINTAFIDLTLGMDDGPESIIETANKMGIPPADGGSGNSFPRSTPGLEPVTGVALGSQTVSPINMANGYATIANDGVATEPYIIEKVVDADGETQYQHKVTDARAISPEIAADVSYALQQVVQSGSGTEALNLGRPAAGKTGTATKTGGAVSSSWFVGYTPQLSTAVMYVRGQGNGQLDDGWIPASSDGREGYFGGNYPAKTWTAVMSRDLEGVEEEDFPEPAFVDGDAPEGYEPPYVPPPPSSEEPPPPPPPASTEPQPTAQPPTQEPEPEPTQEPTEEPPPPTEEPEEPEPPLPTAPQTPGGATTAPRETTPGRVD